MSSKKIGKKKVKKREVKGSNIHVKGFDNIPVLLFQRQRRLQNTSGIKALSSCAVQASNKPLTETATSNDNQCCTYKKMKLSNDYNNFVCSATGNPMHGQNQKCQFTKSGLNFPSPDMPNQCPAQAGLSLPKPSSGVHVPNQMSKPRLEAMKAQA